MDTSERLERLSPARPAHDRIEENYDLIERRLSEGVRLSAIADVLGMSPKTLSNGLSLLRKAKGSKPKSGPVEGKQESSRPEAKQSKPSPTSTTAKPAPAPPAREAKPAPSPDHMPAGAIELDGEWITGERVKWWPPPKVSDGAPAECPLPMPLRYALPVDLRPKDMPAVPDDWSIYKLTAGKRDKHRLPDTGSVLRKWWCFFSPRLSSTSRLYGVLPGIDPEAPYGRYPDGRPYTSDDEVWGLGQGGAVRQLSMIDKVPPGEVTPVDLFLGFPGASSSSVGDALLFDPAESHEVLEWKAAAERCGQPTDPPEVT